MKNKKNTINIYLVGQGMCALIKSNDIGYLLDCGAGTPIKKDEFIKNNKLTKTKDDLINDIDNLEDIKIIISHFDSDHYRLFRWSKLIFEKTSTIYGPSNQVWPDILDKNIKSRIKGNQLKIISCENQKTILFDGFKITIYRSRKINKNKSISKAKNDNCLITLVEFNNKNFLFPGDYLLSNFSNDSDKIKSLCDLKYEFISVPHHGAKDCIDNTLNKQHKQNESLAFFSAGNNKAYNHPHTKTIKSYTKKGFSIYYIKEPKKITKAITFT